MILTCLPVLQMLLLVVLHGLVLVAREAGGRASPAPRPLGAPDTFTLFHPVLPGQAAAQGGPTADTDRAVPVLQINRQKDGEKVNISYLGLTN